MASSDSDATTSSEEDPLDMTADEGWHDVDDEESEAIPIVSFFSKDTFATAKAMLDDVKARYSFDFIGLKKQMGSSLLSRPVLAH